ncbi:MAG TPA: site-specific recombinase [Methylophilaceae bacterium]
METILQRGMQENETPAMLIAALVARIRPPRRAAPDYASNMLNALCHTLNAQPELRAVLRNALMDLISTHKPVSVYAESGILPNTGFFSEMYRRFSHRCLPDAIDPNYLHDLFALVFTNQNDDLWVKEIPDERWLQLLNAMRFDEDETAKTLPLAVRGMIDAVLVLSYRISSIGLEPELIRNEPSLEEFESPFLTQNDETGEYLEQFAKAWEKPRSKFHDAKHVMVLLDQCKQVIAKIRRTAASAGTSISLTFLLQREAQQIERMEALLAILEELRQDRTGTSAYPMFIALFKNLVTGECHKNDLRKHWSESMELLALRVTENAGRTGEHYITDTRSEYFAMMRSALGAGIIIPFMAMIKIFIVQSHMPPLTEGIAIALNYGLGFVLIHIMHFTIATKQPAMTAAAIAASIGESGGGTRDLENLTTLIAQMMRSQLIAIIGNVILAIPIAMLIAYGLQGFISVEKAHHLLADANPIHGLAIFYAAIAGVCLFLSGLIAGHHDNLAVYNKIPQRIQQLKWLRWLLGEYRLSRVAEYIQNNLGALAGNFYFGCMLGGITAIGVLTGLPLDIRHVTFSSSFLGFSLVTLDFHPGTAEIVWASIGVTLIALTNLTLSFALALSVAMKARKITFSHWRVLLQSLGRRLRQHPREFFLPPKREKDPAENALPPAA